MSEEKTIKEEIIELKPEGNLLVCKINGETFGFRKLTWGEKNKIMEISQKMSPIDGKLDFNVFDFNINLLLATLKKAPFNVNKQTLESYPDAKLIDILLQITTDLNIVGKQKIQNL
jgi:hypothetical protein